MNHAQARWLFALCLEQQDKPREAVNQLKLLLKHSRKDIKKINQLAHYAVIDMDIGDCHEGSGFGW